MNKQIELLIDRFNTGWTQGNFSDIAPLLDESVVFVAPDLKTEIIGKSSCLQTIKDYVNHAKTMAFEVKHKEIHSWSCTAMISIDYYIKYEMKNEIYQEVGKEFWTLNKVNDSWKLVWRAMVNNEKVT